MSGNEAKDKQQETYANTINRLLGINESYKAPERIMEIVSDKETADKVFSEFLREFNYDLSYEWFSKYFEDERSDRKVKKQDFTPPSITKLLAELAFTQTNEGIIYEPTAGTGGIVISHWYRETKKHLPWEYRADRYLYICEELSDGAVPFLLFNLLIRCMNAVVIHGDTLTREAKEVYHCCNTSNSYTGYSELRKLPHIKAVEKMFNIRFCV